MQVDEACSQECAKDLMCSPDDALPQDECFELFCDYVSFVEVIVPSEAYLRCMGSYLSLLNCLVPLSCADYLAYYESDGSEDYPCAMEDIAWSADCAEFDEAPDKP